MLVANRQYLIVILFEFYLVASIHEVCGFTYITRFDMVCWHDKLFTNSQTLDHEFTKHKNSNVGVICS